MNLGNLPITLVALPFGLFPLGFGVWRCCLELSPRGWIKASGKIVTSKTEQDFFRNTFVGLNQTVPVIEYEFFHNGQIFKSSQRTHGNYISGNNKTAESVTLRYPVNSDVTVFVNPRNPEKSVLEYGVTPSSWVFILLGLAFTIFAVLPLVFK